MTTKPVRMPSNPTDRLRSALAARPASGLFDVLFVPTVLLALILYLSFTTQFFLTETNILNVFLQGAVLAVVAFGATYVILSGELDLSVGSGVALVSVLGALVMRDTGSILLGVLVGLGTGIALGVINGALVTVLQIPSFIATLGTMVSAHGLALAITGGGVLAGVPTEIGNFVTGSFLGIRWILWTVIVVFAVLYYIQRSTAFGRHVLAVGGNRQAARAAAISVDWVRFKCFVIAGVTVGIGGLILLARVESGQPNAAQLLGLMSIAAIVVGGTNLLGGSGSVLRTLWGVLLVTILQNGMDLKGVNSDLQQVILGLVFIAAASTVFMRSQLSERWRRRVLRRERAEASGEGPVPARQDSS